MSVLPKTNKEPTQGEKRFVQEVLLQGEAPLWMQWVTKRKRDKIQDRLLVVGRYKIFSIKRGVTGKKTIKRVGHIFDLKEIFSADVDRVVFKFKDFDIDIQARGAGTDMLYNLRVCMQQYTCSFADYALPKITLLPPDRILQSLPTIDYGPCHGILATYDAYCNYYKTQPNQEFIKFIYDLSMKGVTDFILDECPGIERKEQAINFVPIKSALRHNTFFKSFIFRNIQRREIADSISDTLTHNITLQKIVLSGCDARDESFIAIGNSFKKNQLNSIVDIDFSNNPMKEKGASGLGEGLQFFPHSLLRLNLSNCELNTKGVSSIVQSFCFGKEVAHGLVELDLSHNNVSTNGASHLGDWFSQVTVNCQLKYLLLSNTKIDAAFLFRAMKNATIRSLEEIDISANKIDIATSQTLCGVIDSLPVLRVLNVAYCSLVPQSVEGILRSITNNTNLSDVSVNISGNELGIAGAVSVSQILLITSNISSLWMKNCGFKKEGLTKIVGALGQNIERTTLRVLDLGNNFASGTAAKMTKLISALAEVVKKHPSLEYLGLSGNGDKMSIGKEIEPLFRALSSNPKLVELNITGNKIGDQMAVMLCDQLRSNFNLRSLLWDINGISIGGWRAFLNLCQTNQNLIHCPTPNVDIDRAIKESKNKDQFKDKIKEILDLTRDALKQNSGGMLFVSVSKIKQGKTYGDNFRQFIGLGVSGQSQDPNIIAQSNSLNTLRHGTSRDSTAIGYGALPNPQTDYNYQDPPNSGFHGVNSGYEAPPPPPPPLGSVQRDNSYTYEDPPAPPPRDEYGNDYSYQQSSLDFPAEYDDTQYETVQYENTQNDDTQYESYDSPPPPPPL